MSQALLIVLGVYLAGCYACGGYLLVKLWATRTHVRPTSRLEPTELARAARAELQADPAAEQRLAA